MVETDNLLDGGGGDNLDIKIIPPDYRLKNKIGADIDIKQIFTEDAIKKAQNAIEDNKDKFLEWVEDDIIKLEELYVNAIANPATCKQYIIDLEKISDKIKAQSGTFGFSLATSVAKSLCKFCNNQKAIKPTHLIVIRKHIDTLSVIFKNKIHGDGGVVGGALHDGLKKLVEKYN